ncbi:hypothetical protein B5G41_10640 [Alistipes onderdonkii]|uniref:Uncharacterized protein n=1 Tax=Alistipes onderdonkii TaxID=328813 RepID=A0A1Y3QYN0_9BACT|nr:hypothetical protein B5G41_10640 [Alistipes onderdonkii]
MAEPSRSGAAFFSDGGASTGPRKTAYRAGQRAEAVTADNGRTTGTPSGGRQAAEDRGQQAAEDTAGNRQRVLLAAGNRET